MSASFAYWLIGHISLGELIDHNGLVSFVGLGIAGFIGLTLDSLGGLIGHISLVGLCIIGLISSSTHRLFCEHLATAVHEATKIRWLEHEASHGVAAALRMSASKIVNAPTTYYVTSLLHVCSFVREKMCSWLALAKKKMWLWIATFGESYNGDVLQLAQ